MKSSTQNSRGTALRLAGTVATLLAGAYVASPAQAVPTQANLAGEIERITLDDINVAFDRIRQMPIGHFFDAMTNGFGTMSDYRAQVEVADRWAIALWVRILSRSQHAALADVPADQQAGEDEVARLAGSERDGFGFSREGLRVLAEGNENLHRLPRDHAHAPADRRGNRGGIPRGGRHGGRRPQRPGPDLHAADREPLHGGRPAPGRSRGRAAAGPPDGLPLRDHEREERPGPIPRRARLGGRGLAHACGHR